MKKLKRKKSIIIILLISLIIIFGLIWIFIPKDTKEKIIENINTTEKENEESKKLTIIDENSKSRSYAVMINNHPSARAHHAGLQDAYIIYEFIVEGGLTRYLALFKDQDTEKIGSVRSSRHYFLDYVLENDAIYVHWGYSPQAQQDIKSLNIDNIDGLVYEGKYFYRDKSLGVSLEHTGFTTMDYLKEATKKLNYRDITDSETLLNYSVEPIDLSTMEESIEATNVVIKYSSSVENSYVYDSELKVYKRYVNDKAHIDDITKEQYTFKNIIT